MTAPPTTRPRAPEILYQDDAVVAVMKPSGLAVHRGWAVADHYALDLVRDAVGRHVFPAHRLDQPTSGVLLFGLDRDVARTLGDRFAAQGVFKRYLALVRGPASTAIDRIDHPLVDLSGPPDAPARAAVTTIRGLATAAGRYSLVEAIPETGRSHQIRRHLKHRSLHIIGDVKYGKGEHNRLFRERYGLHRLALHALQLALPHPVTGAWLTLRAPIPADLDHPLRLAGFDLEAALTALTAPPEPPCPHEPR